MTDEGATTFDPIRASVPLSDPRAAKDQLLRGWKPLEGQFGLPSGGDALERLATHDLLVHDAVKRDDGSAPRVNPESPEDRRARQAEFAARAAEQSGVVVAHQAPRFAIVPVLDLPPHLVSPRWPYALGRLARILEGATPTFTADGAIDWRATTATCGHPRLAYAYMDLRMYFDFRLVPQTQRHNPFWGMSARDAGLKFQAEVENICDRSTGTMHQWWVPK